MTTDSEPAEACTRLLPATAQRPPPLTPHAHYLIVLQLQVPCFRVWLSWLKPITRRARMDSDLGRYNFTRACRRGCQCDVVTTTGSRGLLPGNGRAVVDREHRLAQCCERQRPVQPRCCIWIVVHKHHTGEHRVSSG